MATAFKEHTQFSHIHPSIHTIHLGLYCKNAYASCGITDFLKEKEKLMTEKNIYFI